MKDFIGKDLAGWWVETWYEVRVSAGPPYGGQKPAGYFTDRDLAEKFSQGKDLYRYNSKGTVAEVSVLTKDGVTGFIVKTEPIEPITPDALKAQSIKEARNKLTEEDRSLLGIE